jgi:mRNA interferase MazF
MIKIEPNSKNGLTKESSADCFQVRSVSQDRFVKRLGVISDSIMEEIRIGLSKVLSIDTE